MKTDHIVLTFNFIVNSFDKIFYSPIFQPTPEFREQLEAIKNFYKETMHHAVEVLDRDLGIATAEQYQKLYSMFVDLKSEKITRENALDLIEEITNNRIDRINSNNLFYACQLLFFTALGIGTLAAFYMLAPLAVTIGPILAIISALVVFACNRFESTTPIYDEKERYKDAISFFKPEPNRTNNTTQIEPDPEMLFCGEHLSFSP